MDLSTKSLVSILSKRIEDDSQLEMMEYNALETAKRRFSMALQAEKTPLFYEKLLNGESA